MGRAVDHGSGQRIAVGIGVVGQHAVGCVDRQRRVLVGLVRIVDGDGQTIDLDGHRGRGRCRLAVVDGIGERVGPVEAGVGRVVERAVGVERQRAVGRVIDQRRRQGVAVGVGVVGEDPRGRVDHQHVVRRRCRRRRWRQPAGCWSS